MAALDAGVADCTVLAAGAAALLREDPLVGVGSGIVEAEAVVGVSVLAVAVTVAAMGALSGVLDATSVAVTIAAPVAAAARGFASVAVRSAPS